MSKKRKLAYDGLSEDAKFREQYRFVFAVAVIATVFVVPYGNALEIFLKATLGFSALFAAIFLIASAAKIKYSEPGRLYEVFYVGERFRMWAFDWSLHVFAAAFLVFVGLIITGLIEKILGFQFDTGWSWAVVFGITLTVGLAILFITNKMMAKKSKKKLPKI